MTKFIEMLQQQHRKWRLIKHLSFDELKEKLTTYDLKVAELEMKSRLLVTYQGVIDQLQKFMDARLRLESYNKAQSNELKVD